VGEGPAEVAEADNAQAESLFTKPMFARLIESHRCLVPADGFYEWAKPKKAGGRKQPYHIRLRGGGLFACPWLWDEWKGPNGKKVYSCCIVTTDANELLRPIHERMPAILPPGRFEAWLAPESEPADLKELLASYPADEMEAVAVGTLVNSPANDGPECLIPLSA
jgi:putative SOS response-associated peptidase YedK